MKVFGISYTFNDSHLSLSTILTFRLTILLLHQKDQHKYTILIVIYKLISSRTGHSKWVTEVQFLEILDTTPKSIHKKMDHYFIARISD